MSAREEVKMAEIALSVLFLITTELKNFRNKYMHTYMYMYPRLIHNNIEVLSQFIVKL